MAARIIFSGNNIDFSIDPSDLKTEQKEKVEIIEVSSGKVFGHDIMSSDIIKAPAILTLANVEDLEAWWAWAKQLNTFSFAKDNSLIGETTLNGAAASGQADIVVDNASYFSSTNKIVLLSTDRTKKEVKTIDSIASSTITCTSNLIYSYSDEDILRHKDYYESMINVAKTFSPARLKGSLEGNERYKYTFEFRESY